MALRKLQAEIDRTLKTVATGVELFESTFDKLNHASNATQKDKFEQDLKTQIKKLQRLRDQIKVWLGSSDIKDKSALFDNRKLIETQMERFKALEKEMKMKAFSKEGLIAAAKLDPAEKAKRDTIDWIGTTTDELSRQIEQTEAEAETLQATGKKKKQAGDRLGELETLNERRTWHIGRLEVVQRMLENGQLTVEQVESVQEDVKYFVEANTEEDFDFDGEMYDDLNLQDEDVDYMQDYAQTDELSNMDTSSVTDGGDAPKTPAKEEKRPSSTTKEDSPSHPPSPVAARKVPLKKPTLETVKAEVVKTPTKNEVTAPVQAPSSAPKPAALPPIRYAAAAAAAVTTIQSITSPPVPTVPAPAPGPMIAEPPAPVPAAVSPPVEEKAVESPIPAPAEIAQSNGHPPPPPPGLSAPQSTPPSQPAQPPTFSQPKASHPQSQPQPPAQSQPRSQTPVQVQPQTNGNQNQNQPPPPGYPTHAESSRSASTVPYPSGSSSATISAGPSAGTSVGQAATASSAQRSGSAGLPKEQQGVLGGLINSFDIAKELSERRANDVNELHSALDVSYHNAPQQIDAEPPRYYHPRNPVATPSYYPQHKLPILEDKTIYSRLELDQLFYIFYYMTGTYEQWLAARELKRQSWRFHKQYLTWFQRAHNPQAITEDYEQGGYFYFDWENSWCQRKKSDFRFEYRWLSDH